MIKDFKLELSNLDSLNELLKMGLTNGAMRVNAVKWQGKRSLAANSQVHVWYKQIADTDGEDVKSVECQCKRMFGLPILLTSARYGEKVSWTLNKLDFFNWNWEQQCGYMELLPVTRLFEPSEHKKYRDEMQAFYCKNGIPIDYLN